MPEIDREIHRAEQALREAKHMLTLADVYRHFRVDRRTVYRWVNAGMLKAYKFPVAGYRFEPADVEAFRVKHLERSP